MIIVNPIQSFTEQDMSDDPIYPSPTVKGQKVQQQSTRI